jgi:hypothetical protein
MKTYKILIIICVLIAGLMVVQGIVTKRHNAQPNILDGFAKSLNQKGATFYGHYQCSHCKKQKDLFETAQQYLPYVECGILSKDIGTGQTKTCEDKKIEGYPTWIFADGSRTTGEQSIQSLSDKTGIPVPAEYKKPTKDKDIDIQASVKNVSIKPVTLKTSPEVNPKPGYAKIPQ